MPDISAAIRNAVSEKTAEIQRLADQLEDILYQAGLAQRRGSHKDSRCEDIKNICQDIAAEVTPPQGDRILSCSREHDQQVVFVKTTEKPFLS
jgi:hypothetical protein